MSDPKYPRWAWPRNARKAHVFSNGMSLCGKWAFFGEQDEQPQAVTDEPGADDCVVCWRKLNKQGVL